MHEFGVVMHIISTVENVAKENDLTNVNSVTLEVGEVSSILPDYLTDCWNYAHKKSEMLKDSELKIEMLPAVSVCNSCGETYSTIKYAKDCPKCKSNDTQLMCGDEFNIKEIEAY